MKSTKIFHISLLGAFFLIPTASLRAQASAQNSVSSEYANLAKAFKEEGNSDKAISYYQKALDTQKDNFSAAFDLATLYFEKNNLEKAAECYSQAIGIKSDVAAAHYNLGLCYNNLKKSEQAVDAFTKTVALQPNHPKAAMQLTQILEKLNKHEEALSYAKRAIATNPHDSDALYHAGKLYKHFDKFDEAIDLYKKAIKINPKNVMLLLDLANTLNIMDFSDEAIGYYKKILEINPNAHEVVYNLGYTLKKQGYFREAIEIYQKLIELKPNYSQPHFSLALSYLTLGDFEQGWKEYEWRWSAYNETPRKYKEPTWDGCDLTGKTILVYAEQGLGDTLQFIRYAQLLKSRGARVIFDTQKPLKKVLSLCPYIDQVVQHGETIPPFDFHIPLMSLPLKFNTKKDTIPSSIPYIYADQKLVDYWHTKLSQDKNFKIGLCWQGNAQYSTQFLRKAVAAKSFHANEFATLANVKGISLYSLQKVNGDDQLNDLDNGLIINNFGPDFDESHGRFMDTAAIMKNLDLVITIDTSISHFAGALGVPVWILLPHPADWRWMLNCNDTPWYPNARLFRQPKLGDWQTTMHNVAEALEEFIKAKSQPQPTRSTRSRQESSLQGFDLTEVMDKLSIALLAQESKNSDQVSPEFNELSILFQTAAKELPELNLILQQLKQINQELQTLDKQLALNKHTVFNDSFIEISRSIYHAHDIKTYLKKKISSLQKHYSAQS